MRLKIGENLRIASLNSKFTVLHKKKVYFLLSGFSAILLTIRKQSGLLESTEHAFQIRQFYEVSQNKVRIKCKSH